MDGTTVPAAEGCVQLEQPSYNVAQLRRPRVERPELPLALSAEVQVWEELCTPVPQIMAVAHGAELALPEPSPVLFDV
jgi:hypothetical protein